MDRPLSNRIILKGRIRSFLIIAGALITIGASWWLLRTRLHASVQRNQLRIATVEEGPVENTLNASGVILPEYEQVIAAPINASIEAIYKNAGSPVQTGEAILLLNKEFSQLEYEKLHDEWELKRNNIGRLRLELEKNLRDLDLSDSIKALRINSLMAGLDDTRRLAQVGGGTKEEIQKAVLELEIARLEKKQLENDLNYRRKTMSADLRESEIQAGIQEKTLRELERKLNQAEIRAARPGVVTWLNGNIGAAVSAGDPLVRLADLGSYRLEGSIADVYADRIHSGMTVYAQINETRIGGTIINVHPSIENGIMTFDIALDDKKNEVLRPNMKVDLYVITERRPHTLRVANGTAFKGGKKLHLFVLRNDHLAERRQIDIGLSNFDYVELLSNISAGEQVVISDLSYYRNVRELKINQ